MPVPSDVDAIRVTPVSPVLADAVRRLRVHPAQYGFVGDITRLLAETGRDPCSEAMAILCGEAVVGFYRLDFQPVVLGGRSLGRHGVALRSLMVDHRRQGRGIGGRAVQACCDDLRERHPGRTLLALLVNCSNLPALRLYRAAGFVDTGEFYVGGPSGPQHVMLRRLDAVAAGE